MFSPVSPPRKYTLGIKTPSVALASVSPKMKIKEYARFEY